MKSLYKLLLILIFSVSVGLGSTTALAARSGVYIVVNPPGYYYNDRGYYDDYGPSYYQKRCYWVPAHWGKHGRWHPAQRVCRYY